MTRSTQLFHVFSLASQQRQLKRACLPAGTHAAQAVAIATRHFIYSSQLRASMVRRVTSALLWIVFLACLLALPHAAADNANAGDNANADGGDGADQKGRGTGTGVGTTTKTGTTAGATTKTGTATAAGGWPVPTKKAERPKMKPKATLPEITHRVYLDVEFEDLPNYSGRVVLGLFGTVAPRAVENFRALCACDRGNGRITDRPLCYKGTEFHRISECM
jgi:hypothetical protein